MSKFVGERSNNISKYDTTTDDELKVLGRKMFGKKFRGVYLKGKEPKLKNNEMAVLNTGEGHWFGIYKKNGKKYEWDSFSQDIMGKNYKDSHGKKPVQKYSETNCGQRVLAHFSQVMK